MKLIDADALLVALRDYWAEGTNETGMEVLDKIIVSLENKGADAEPVKHGMWIDEAEDWRNQIEWFKCSQCDFPTSTAYKYCPNCGARMDEE